MYKDDGFILQPYFTPMIEREFPELIKAREKFEEQLPKWLPNTKEDRECYIAFLDFMNRTMTELKTKEAEFK